MKIRVKLNGHWREDDVEPRLLLVHYLREAGGLTGTHIGCETSICGACTILLNGDAVKSCTLFAVQADGAEITTIEGLSADSRHPVQQAWLTEQVPQCGYCQSGQIMATAAYLRTNPNPTDAEIDANLTNICRCGTYERLRRAVHRAAALMKI